MPLQSVLMGLKNCARSPMSSYKGGHSSKLSQQVTSSADYCTCRFLTMSQALTEEQRINVCKTAVSQIYTMLRSSPHDWRDFLGLTRTIIVHLDSTTFMQQASRTGEQAWAIAALQRLAFMDADHGAVTDIAAWSTRQWLVIFARDSQNLAALRGIGQTWLSRAQPALTRIHRVDGSTSSSGGSSQWSAPSLTASEDERISAQAELEAERRAGSPDYVEAQGFLQPATEYLERAVAAAHAQHALSGDLLANVSSPY